MSRVRGSTRTTRGESRDADPDGSSADRNARRAARQAVVSRHRVRSRIVPHELAAASSDEYVRTHVAPAPAATLYGEPCIGTRAVARSRLSSIRTSVRPSGNPVGTEVDRRHAPTGEVNDLSRRSVDWTCMHEPARLDSRCRSPRRRPTRCSAGRVSTCARSRGRCMSVRPRRSRSEHSPPRLCPAAW